MSNMYWEYAGTRYDQKFLALQAAGKNFHSIKFNAFGSAFHNFDWSVEPPQSFTSLCELRAKQLRDQYSYIKLYFSGGADSTTMLNSFLRTNTYIDEIVVFRFSLVDKFDCQSNSEANEYAIPYLKNINLSNTKIKILDIGSEYFSELFSDDKFFFKKNNIDLRETYLPKIRGKNFCHLFGDTDPSLVQIEGKWYETIFDSNNYGEYRFRNMEMFFTSESLPELHSKQCHLLKNFFNKNQEELIRDDWKSIIRDKPINNTPDEFVKRIFPIRDFRWMAKDFTMLKHKNTKIFRDKYYSLLSQKIDGIRVVDLFDGIKGETFCLGN